MGPMSRVQRGRPKRIPVQANAIPLLPAPAAPAAGANPAPAEEQASAPEALAPQTPRAQQPAAQPQAAQSPPPRRMSEEDAMSAVPPTPGSPQSMGASPEPQSHARTAFLERERAERRQQVEDPKRSRIAAVFGDGPTVEEPTELDDYFEEEKEEVSEEATWTAEEELQAKTKHLREAIDKNESYEVVPGTTQGGLRLTTTWVMAIRDGVLKARLCARDFAKTKRTDLFAPGSTALTNRVIDFKAVKMGLDTYTVDVVAAYNTIDEPEQVIVTPPERMVR